jgi:hypothetical protein
MNTYILISLLSTHFVADFLFQSRNMGRKKGKNIYWLTTHILIYTIVTIFGWVVFFNLFEKSFYDSLTIGLLIFSTHFITDFITSKISGYCYLKTLETKNNNHESSKWEWRFWSIIGFDQFIHAITLILIYDYLY